MTDHVISSVGSRRAGLARLLVMTVVVVAAGACGQESRESSPAAFRLTASIQDIMLSVVDPSADAIWEAVATIYHPDRSIEERRPETDEEWLALRHEAIRLVESANLMLMEGREVARTGFRSENPGIELEPEQVQALIEDDFETWAQLVGDFYRVSATMLSAIESRDADRLFDEGGPLDVTCERCHQRYWYPDEVGPQPISSAEAPATPDAVADAPAGGGAGGPTGTIEGHVRLGGELPGNPVIRMGVDPHCAQLTEGKQLVQETVVVAPDGSLGNVFVRLQGTFPETAVPDEPVVIDQVDCIFVPRVVGVRAGQLVQIKNSDPLLHNLNTQTTTTNSFNVGQPMQGMVYEVRLAEEDGMLRIRCDLHRWMTEYIGVVPHPYFAVTDLSGTFTIPGVPAGEHEIEVWHEEYGLLTQTVTVGAGGVAMADFSYPSSAP